jgi:hypothetical protein
MKEVELYDVTRNNSHIHADYRLFEGDVLIAEHSARAIAISDLKKFVVENGLNTSVDDLTGFEGAPLDAATYVNDNLHDVVRLYLEGGHE